MSIVYVDFLSKQPSNQVSLTFECRTNETCVPRRFNFVRDLDEPLEKALKKMEARVADEPSKEEARFKLLDEAGNEVPASTLNKDAWREDFRLVLNGGEQEFQVCVNLPHVRKLALPGRMIAGMPAIVRMEADESDEQRRPHIERCSLFKWFHSKQDYASLVVKEEASSKQAAKQKTPAQPRLNLGVVEWIPLAEGVDLRMCLLPESTEDRLIRVVCVPSDGKREGMTAEIVSTTGVEPCLDLSRFPLTKRLENTQHRLEHPDLRVVTYNLLAKSFTEDADNVQRLYPYCPTGFIDFAYRRILLRHEIAGFNADIVFLQECEREFATLELAHGFPGYSHAFEAKHNGKEGEAVLFRSDRFKLVKSHNLVLKHELQNNPFFARLWSRIEQNDQFHKTINSKNTILQLVQIERLDDPSHHILLANTHLYYKGNADFLRLLQTIASLKHIEKVRLELASEQRRVDVLFGGDFNSSPTSHSFVYATESRLQRDQISRECRELISDYSARELALESLRLRAASVAFPFTHCIGGFEAVLDYVFYEPEAFELVREVPLPPAKVVKTHVALPSELFPSDHLPLIYQLRFKTNSNLQSLSQTL